MAKPSDKKSSITSIAPSSKLQKRPKKSHEEIIAEITTDLEGLMKMWRDTKNLMLKAFLQKPITDEDESVFLDLKSRLSRLARSVNTRCPDYLEVGVGDIQNIIKAGVNLQVLSQLPTITKKGLYGKWHVANVQMHRTQGALKLFNEGYRPQKEKNEESFINRLAQNLSGMFGHKVEGKDENPIKTLVIIIIGIVAAVALIVIAVNLTD